MKESSCAKKYDYGEGEGGVEKTPKIGRYFVVGLSGGVSSVQMGERLKISIDLLRYVDFLKSGGSLVIFDVQNLGYKGVDKGAFDRALEEMEVRLEGISMSQGGKVKVTRASSVVSEERGKFDFLVSGIKGILREDNLVQEKIWKIVPPSVKGENSKYAKFSDVPVGMRDEAYSLMEYEVLHLAFILANNGTKIAHGRSEERSTQLVKYLKERYGERLGCSSWSGEVRVGEVKSPRIFADRYPLPYGLASRGRASEQASGKVPKHMPGKASEQVPGHAVDCSGSLPISTNIAHIHEIIMDVLSRGGEESLRRYLATLPGLESFSDGLDFSDPEAVYLTTSLLVSKCIWPVEYGELTVAKEKFEGGEGGDFEKRVKEKLVEFEGILKLSPQLKVIIEDIMPVFFRKPGEGVEERLRWLFEGLGCSYVVFYLANNYERVVMLAVMEMIRELYQLFNSKKEEVSYNSWWMYTLEFAEEFYFERLDNPGFAGDGMVSSEKEKARLVEPLRRIAKVLSLNGDFEETAEFLDRRLYVMRSGNYCPISSQARNFILERVVLPYLGERKKARGEDCSAYDSSDPGINGIKLFRAFVKEKILEIRERSRGRSHHDIFDDEIALQQLCLVLVGLEQVFHYQLVYGLPLDLLFSPPEATPEYIENISRVFRDQPVFDDYT